MINLSVVKSIVGNKKSIVCGGKEWREIVKLLPSGISDNEKYIFLSGDDLNSDSIFDLLFECGVEVVYN
jgi:hypothetical protein